MAPAAKSHIGKSPRNTLISQNVDVFQDFEPIKKLGEGSFGTAQLVRQKSTGQQRVLKAIRKDGAVPPEVVSQEVELLKALDHPNIIRIFGHLEDVHFIYILMEPAGGGELLKAIQEIYQEQSRAPGEPWVALVVSQCLSAVSYCHEREVLHKDLKPENIMLLSRDRSVSPHAVIIDFGVAEVLHLSRGGQGRRDRLRANTWAGTCLTMAPEVWAGDFGPKCDVWSMGCVLFWVLSGHPPFMTKDINNGREWTRLHKAGPNWHLLSHVSPLARQICQRMLSFDERMRPTAAQCLRHNWFSSQTPTAPVLDKTALEALCSYSNYSSLTHAVSMKLATMMNSAGVEHLTRLFQDCDVDRDGVLSSQELANALRNAGIDDASAAKLAQKLAADGSGGMDYTTFLAATLTLSHQKLDDLLLIEFNKMDKDKSGSLSREELREVLTAVGCGAQTDRILQTVDSSYDGRVQFAELLSHLKIGRTQADPVDLQEKPEGNLSIASEPPTNPVPVNSAEGADIELLLSEIETHQFMDKGADVTSFSGGSSEKPEAAKGYEAQNQLATRRGASPDVDQLLGELGF